MEILILLMVFPVISGIIARYYLKHTYTLKEMGLSIAISLIAISVVFFGSKYQQMMDVEILNGEITGKSRDHGTYLESYSCNCRTVSHGSGNNRYTTTQCDTCYRRHYTVTWSATSTVGTITFDHKDSTSTTVYLSPDP